MVAAARPLRAAAARPAPRLDARHAGRCCSRRSRCSACCSRSRTSGRSSYLSTAVAFFSASQDIVLDAFRREILPDAELGLGTSIHVNAYRISSLVPGRAGADPRRSHAVVVRCSSITALFMLPGIAMTLVVAEPALVAGRAAHAARGGRRAVPRVHHAQRLARGAARAAVHLPLQARRQHGDRARDAVLPRHGLHQDRHRRRSPRTPACGRA